MVYTTDDTEVSELFISLVGGGGGGEGKSESGNLEVLRPFRTFQ